MLYSIDKGEYVKRMPYQQDFERWRDRLTADEFQAIVDDLRSRMDGAEIQTSSWIPGSDWSNTVFHPIYERACEFDHVASGRCFGLFLWHVVMQHPDAWGFGRYEKDGVPIEGITYFRLANPPPDAS